MFDETVVDVFAPPAEEQLVLDQNGEIDRHHYWKTAQHVSTPQDSAIVSDRFPQRFEAALHSYKLQAYHEAKAQAMLALDTLIIALSMEDDAISCHAAEDLAHFVRMRCHGLAQGQVSADDKVLLEMVTFAGHVAAISHDEEAELINNTRRTLGQAMHPKPFIKPVTCEGRRVHLESAITMMPVYGESSSEYDQLVDCTKTEDEADRDEFARAVQVSPDLGNLFWEASSPR